jgi:hypothetical protein
MVFALAKILGLKKLRQTDDLGSASGGFLDPAQGFLEILLWFRSAGHLHQSYAEFLWRHASLLRDQYSIVTRSERESEQTQQMGVGARKIAVP